MTTTQLDVNDLFTPADSGVGSNPNATPAAGTWLAILYQIANQIGLPTTSFQPGEPERTMIALAAVALSQEDFITSLMNQGGFLDFAADGVVTMTAINGQTVTQSVTPDPTIQSQWPAAWAGVWQPGWLDLLAQSRYGLDRIGQTAATNLEAIVNTTASPLSTYSPGTFHVANPTSGSSYSNLTALTVPSSRLAGTAGVVTAITGTGTVTVTTQTAHGLSAGQVVYISGYAGITLAPAVPGGGAVFAKITAATSTTFTFAGTSSGAYVNGGTVYLCTVATFAADLGGVVGSSAPNTITSTVTSNNGVFCANLVAFVGISWESNDALADRCRLSIQSRSPNGPSGAYKFFALTASEILAAQTPPVTMDGGPITKVLVQGNPVDGSVTVTVANGSGSVEGAANLPVTGAANNGSGLIRLAVLSTSRLTDLDFGTVSGVIGTIEANGLWQMHVIDGSHVDLVGSTFTNAYVSGGSVEAGDLGQVDLVLQQNCVPDDIVLNTQSASAEAIIVVTTVTVPSSRAAAYPAAAQAALVQYFASDAVAIGGDSGFVRIADVEGVLYGAGAVNGGRSYVTNIPVLTLNGVAADRALSSPTSIPILSGSSTVNGVVI